MDTVEVLRRVGSVARTGTVRQHGVSRRNIRHALETGRVVHLRRGVLALPDAPADIAAAAMHNGRVTCVSAARHYGLWQLHAPTSHHLSCPEGYSGDNLNHRRRTVPVHKDLPLVGLVDVLIHALHCLPPVEAAVMVESALRRGETVRSLLLKRLQGDRNGKARAALDLVTGCAESPLEVVARILFRGAGFHVDTQVYIDGVGRVDFLLEGFLVVEVDGDKYHSDRQARRNDQRRNNMTIIGGYLVLRYRHADIVHNGDVVLTEIWQVLSGRVIR